jgi:hypothetical protein
MRFGFAIAIVAGCSFEPVPAATPDTPVADAIAPLVDAAPPIDGETITSACPTRYSEKYNGHSYAPTGFTNRANAAADCASDGGHLIKIEDDAEALELAERVTIIPTVVWIGLVDEGNGYRWHDGTGVGFERWDGQAPTSPDSADCVVLNTVNGNGRWQATSCNQNFIGVCECDDL